MNKITYLITMLLLSGTIYLNGASPDKLNADARKDPIEIIIRQDTVPVLIGKEMNPLLRINVFVPGETKKKKCN